MPGPNVTMFTLMYYFCIECKYFVTSLVLNKAFFDLKLNRAVQVEVLFIPLKSLSVFLIQHIKFLNY